MKIRTHHFVIALATAGLTALPSLAQCPPESEQDDDISERGIVHVRPDSTIDAFLADMAAAHADIGVSVLDQIPNRAIYLLAFDIPKTYNEDEIEVELNENFEDTLISGEFLYEAEAPEGKTGSTWVDGLSQDDMDTQFTHELIGTPVAHQQSIGNGTVVAVLDTGIDATHEAFAGRIAPFGYDFIENDDDPADVGDGINNDPLEDDDIDEMTGHGTFVSGIITMIAPGTKVLPIRVLDSDGGGDGWALTQGLFYAIDQGVEVINLSVGSTYETATVNQAIVEAAARGIVVVAAVGNFNCEDVRERPAMDDIDAEDAETNPAVDLIGAFGVVATDPSDVKTPFSNYHRKAVISAPGGHDDPLDPQLAIVSTLPGGLYGTWEGTSFATPMVAATIAMVRAQHPEWEPGPWPDPQPPMVIYNDVHRLITEHSFDHYPLNDPLHKGELGSGRLDAAATIAAGPTAPPVGDLNADGVVGFADVLRVLTEWGRVHSSADLDGDGTVSLGDILVVLSNWT